MTTPKDVLIAAMGVGGVQHLIERAYREGSELQYLRELFKNSLEAGATRIEFGPEWQAVEQQGVYRLMVADNGKGMGPEELLRFLNTFGGGETRQRVARSSTAVGNDGAGDRLASGVFGSASRRTHCDKRYLFQRGI